MAHYFENDPNLQDEKGTYTLEWDHTRFVIATNAGVFSREGLDTGTRILLEAIQAADLHPGTVLDFGCGVGVAGVILHTLYPQASITGIDVSERACALAQENYARYGIQGEVLCQDGLQKEQGDFDLIALNPPIRTGKETIYRLFAQAAAHLSAEGSLWIVIRKQHGAASAEKYLKTLFDQVTRPERSMGFWVLKASSPKPQITGEQA